MIQNICIFVFCLADASHLSFFFSSKCDEYSKSLKFSTKLNDNEIDAIYSTAIRSDFDGFLSKHKKSTPKIVHFALVQKKTIWFYLDRYSLISIFDSESSAADGNNLKNSLKRQSVDREVK